MMRLPWEHASRRKSFTTMLLLGLAAITASAMLTGCTLWRILIPSEGDLLRQEWSLDKESKDPTGKYSLKVEPKTQARVGKRVLSVVGKLIGEQEVQPKFVYKVVRHYRRAVEAIFLTGEVERTVYVTDPPPPEATGEAAASEITVGKSTTPFWQAIEPGSFPPVTLEWELSESGQGPQLGRGQVLVPSSGEFEIQLDGPMVDKAAQSRNRTKILKVEVPDQQGANATLISLRRDLFVRAAEDG